MYLLAHHYNLILINKIYEQSQANLIANQQLESINNVSSSQVLLLEAISHEIKSPLMALYFLIDSISPSGEGLTGIIQRIKSVLNQIGYIVERFSSLTKFYSINDLNIKKNIDISILISSLLEVRPEQKYINLNCDGDARVDSDYVLLQIIFQNLIENAIKYRVDSDSPININVTHFKENILRVDISNSLHKNIRIDLDKIFDIYYRGSNVKNEPGIGVGLWITREIAKKINAEINVIKEFDKVTFTVYIPVSLSI
jgi:signal transduction histidine kinase